MTFSDFITIQCSASSVPLTFLVDTQADISTIKNEIIDEYISLNAANIIKITGITENAIHSLGTTNVSLYFDDVELQHEFHVVDNDFIIPADGIVGKDFLKVFNCTIDYPSMTLTVRNYNNEVNWPISNSREQDTLIIPPKCEIIRQFNINVNGDAVVDAQEIKAGVFIARTIVNSKMPVVKVLNTTNCIQTITNTLTATPLSDFDIIQVNSNESDRKAKIRETVKKNATKNAPPELYDLCEKYSNIFTLDGDQMTVNNFYTQNIKLKDKEPTFVKNYRLPRSQKLEIEKQVNKLLKNKLIEPSTAAYNSPIIIVPKKSTTGEKKYRMCIDYRKLNKKLIADKFPLPRIDEIIDGLGRAKYFSVIDLFSGFHQIPIKKECRDPTTFSTPNGSYRWTVLPFGLNISPNSFTRMMTLAFTGLTPEKCFVYMDDIIVIGKSIKDHLKNLETVFQTCQKYNLKLNPDKCQFFRNEVTYLGHKCTNHGVLPDNTKLSAMVNYPRPHDKDATRRFVAFANYYRKFIPNFATIAKPLNNLTRKNVVFRWGDNCQRAFDELKRCLLNPPILAYPDFSQQFILTVDASAMGCGAVLSQNINDSDLPIAYASKSFNHAESKKAPIEQELIAIHWAIKFFRPYIYDTNFLVKSDHKPLVHLYSLTDPASRLTRLRLDLEEYDFVIEHIKGKKNVCADALSRISFKDIKETMEKELSSKRVMVTTRSMSKKSKPLENISVQSVMESPKILESLNYKEYKKVPIIRLRIEEIQTGQNQNQNALQYNAITQVFSSTNKKSRPLSSFSLKFHDLAQFPNNWMKCLQTEAMKLKMNRMIIEKNSELFNHINIDNFKTLGNKKLKNLMIIIKETPILITDENEKMRIIQQFHENPILGGHIGRNRLYFKIRSKYVWKNMTKDVKNFVTKCQKCQLNKVKIKNIEPLQLTDTPNTSTEKIIIDTVGPLAKSSNGNQYAVTILDDLTKYLVMVPIQSKDAKTVARAIFENYILTFGPMKTIVSDCGTEYVNKVSQELFQLFQIDHKTSAPYRHQTVGSIERTHRVFNEYLRSYLSSEKDWEDNMKYFTFCYNTTPHTTFNFEYTPFELTFGKPTRQIDILKQNNIDPIYNVDNLAKEIKYRLQHAHKRAADLIQKAKERNKSVYDRKIKPMNLKPNDKIVLVDYTRGKFDPVYRGPYLVLDILTNNNVTIRDVNSNKIKTVHKDNVRKYVE